MAERTSKDLLLKNVRKASLQKEGFFNPHIDLETDVLVKYEGSPVAAFARNFTGNNGRFVYCYHEYHFLELLISLIEKNNWQNVVCQSDELRELCATCSLQFSEGKNAVISADVSVCEANALIAENGCVIASSAENKSRAISVFPAVSIFAAYRNSVFSDVKTYFQKLINTGKQLPSALSLIAGPSRTSDIEQKQVIGMHGSAEVYVFYIDR